MVEKLPTMNNWTRVTEKPQNLVHTEEPVSTQPVHTCTTEYKMWWSEWPSVNQLQRRTHQRKTQQQSQPKDIQGANKKNSSNTTCPQTTQQKTRGGGQTKPQLTSYWEGPTKERPNKKQNTTHAQSQHKPQPKISKLRNQEDCITESHRNSTTEVYTMNPGNQSRAT